MKLWPKIIGCKSSNKICLHYILLILIRIIIKWGKDLPREKTISEEIKL
jgi:hypothetical protein